MQVVCDGKQHIWHDHADGRRLEGPPLGEAQPPATRQGEEAPGPWPTDEGETAGKVGSRPGPQVAVCREALAEHVGQGRGRHVRGSHR